MKTAKLEGDKVPGKRIKSTDPRKPDLVALFKRLVPCCSKVTELAERNGCFFARCLAYRPVNGRQTFQNLGVFSLWGDRGATIDPAEQLNATKDISDHISEQARETLAAAKREDLEALARHLAATSSECLGELALAEFLAAAKREDLEALVRHLAATSSECESCDDPAEVLRVIKLALAHPQLTGR